MQNCARKRRASVFVETVYETIHRYVRRDDVRARLESSGDHRAFSLKRRREGGGVRGGWLAHTARDGRPRENSRLPNEQNDDATDPRRIEGRDDDGGTGKELAGGKKRRGKRDKKKKSYIGGEGGREGDERRALARERHGRPALDNAPREGTLLTRWGGGGGARGGEALPHPSRGRGPRGLFFFAVGPSFGHRVKGSAECPKGGGMLARHGVCPMLSVVAMAMLLIGRRADRRHGSRGATPTIARHPRPYRGYRLCHHSSPPPPPPPANPLHRPRYLPSHDAARLLARMMPTDTFARATPHDCGLARCTLHTHTHAHIYMYMLAKLSFVPHLIT